MIRAFLTYDPAVLNSLISDIQTAPARFQRNLQRRFPAFKSAVLRNVDVIPGPPRYPIRWKSERQKRAFFASNGFGRGIPTGRVSEPGGVLGGYDVELQAAVGGVEAEGQLTLINHYPGAAYIIGEFQQPFHADTGWVQVDTVQAQNETLAVDFITETWDETVFEGF